MSESYRGQCNLHLYFADQYLQQARDGDEQQWGGHFRRANVESALWQLRLAYEAHLADLLFQQPRFSQPLSSGRLSAGGLAKVEHPPEIAELADREIHDRHLQWLMDYTFIKPPAAAREYNPALISSVSADADDDWQRAEDCRQFLNETVTRHRSTLQEY
ncbi:DUF6586 family protein [Spongiibacter sp.]|uniref:DUF6586 family protein n=1 Tax=Spongiibacter sp. TaxID=2024860 RepID=UPI003568C2AF